MPFPRLIHQIWLQGQEYIPKEYDDNIASIKTLNPQFQYRLWDECAILGLMKGPARMAYYRFKYLHQKVDFARYVILYELGGMYIDIDAECIKPLEELLVQYDTYDLILSRMAL